MFFNRSCKHHQKLEQLLEGIMAEIDDLKTAVAALTTAVTDTSTELKAVSDALVALKNQGSINPADVETAAQQISTLATNLETAVSGAKTETGV